VTEDIVSVSSRVHLPTCPGPSLRIVGSGMMEDCDDGMHRIGSLSVARRGLYFLGSVFCFEERTRSVSSGWICDSNEEPCCFSKPSSCSSISFGIVEVSESKRGVEYVICAGVAEGVH
jgi:hypothetical protein